MKQTPGAWRQSVILCQHGFEDILSAIAFEAGCAGVREDAVPEGIRLTLSWDPAAIVNPLPAIEDAISGLHSGTGMPPARLMETTEVPWQDWESSWREGLTATESGERLVVRPSWVPYDNTDDRIEIIIDPKMAFGTGHHATTSLCLDALETLDIAGRQVIDAGIGSGVLAIASVKLGADRVHGFDHDEWSVDNARENAAINGVADRIVIDHSSLADWHAEPADILLANMISGVLIPHIGILASLIKPGGNAVFSGLLDTEEAAFINAASVAGFVIDRITHRDEWIAVYAYHRI